MHRALHALTSACVLAGAGCGAEPSPVVVGQVGTTEAGLHAEQTIDVSINGDDRLVAVDRNETFVVQTLPIGELRFQAAIEGITGTMEVHDVTPGEVIEVGVTAGTGRLEMSVLRRDPWAPVEVVPSTTGGTIEIASNHVVYHLDHGVHYGDVVVTGDHVTVVGPNDYGCRPGGRAIIEGDLIVHGHHVRIVNVAVEGRTSILGRHVRVFRSCDLPHHHDYHHGKHHNHHGYD